jgi:branched-chain amino acid transport system substrate-binding protein
MLRRGFLSLFFSVLFIMAVPCLGFAENGVTNDEITVGTATNLTGATVGVAEEFNAGISAYFAKVNKSGGVFGRQIKRLMYNDGYEPEVTLKETLK